MVPGVGSIAISWPLFAQDFQLQQSATLTPAIWSNAAYAFVTNATGVLGLIILAYVWYTNLTVPMSSFALRHWHFIRNFLPAVSACCLLVAVLRGNRRFWVPAMIVGILGIFVFYASLDI